ncbi:hypothetical protein [Sphingomonas sp. ID0503]|uniref:hypothetical protein n=1 Tax=Sphingomonas sp. ID0503 TaxID=3399691 RepID=UPI003AFA92E2
MIKLRASKAEQAALRAQGARDEREAAVFYVEAEAEKLRQRADRRPLGSTEHDEDTLRIVARQMDVVAHGLSARLHLGDEA